MMIDMRVIDILMSLFAVAVKIWAKGQSTIAKVRARMVAALCHQSGLK